jgi:hypothetical protein
MGCPGLDRDNTLALGGRYSQNVAAPRSFRSIGRVWLRPKKYPAEAGQLGDDR